MPKWPLWRSTGRERLPVFLLFSIIQLSLPFMPAVSTGDIKKAHGASPQKSRVLSQYTVNILLVQFCFIQSSNRICCSASAHLSGFIPGSFRSAKKQNKFILHENSSLSSDFFLRGLSFTPLQKTRNYGIFCHCKFISITVEIKRRSSLSVHKISASMRWSGSRRSVSSITRGTTWA